jgi:hypothetical protein
VENLALAVQHRLVWLDKACVISDTTRDTYPLISGGPFILPFEVLFSPLSVHRQRHREETGLLVGTQSSITMSQDEHSYNSTDMSHHSVHLL